MKKAIIFFTAIILFFFGSCSKGKEDFVFLHSYINYYQGGELMVGADLDEEKHPIILASFYNYSCSSPEVYKYNSEENISAFLKIAERNGDRTYDREETISGYSTREYCAYNFKEVHIICENRAWDPDHPAGTLLDEFVEISIYSCADYIRSGYTELPTTKEICKPLNELSETDLSIVDYYFTFYFRAAPAESGIYRFKITMVTTEGEKKEATCEVEFE